MESRLIALKLTLDALDVPCKIDSFNDRKRLQKAVYLAQVGAVDFGYRYGWYIKGPYSPALAEDYYQLASEDTTALDDFRLNGEVLSRLESVGPIFAVPDDLDLPNEDWLELLASVHFLRKVRGASEEEARGILNETKKHVAHHYDSAAEVLSTAGLL